MKQTFSTIRVQSFVKIASRNLMAALALGILFTACKKDDDDNGGGGGGGTKVEESYFPSKANTTWKYRSDDDGDVTEHNVRIVNQKDSAGGKVYHYQVAFDDGSKTNPFVHFANGQITYANPLPSDLQEVLDEVKNDPDASDFSVAGFPMLQRLPASPKVGDAVNFSEPMRIGWKQRDDEGNVHNINMQFGFTNGRILGFEDVTTPAGTFKNCVKWSYKGTLTFKVGNAQPQTTELENTLWYAKGVGPVKSTETGTNTSSTTTLVAVQ